MSDVDNYGRFRAASSVSMDSSFGDEFIGVASQNRIIDEVSFIILYSIRLPVIQVLYMLLNTFCDQLDIYFWVRGEILIMWLT